MNKNVEITSINLKIGEKTLKLSLEEAKKLKDVLNEIFKETIKIEPIVYPITPYQEPYRITWEEGTNQPEFPYGTRVVCENNSLNITI